jgi:Na+-driven multidrug efflux pump
MQTRIVAPLGTVAIAANSFAVTAESLCYMPGYGLGTAATTLVGQSIGAKRKDLAKSFSWITTFMGMAIMGAAGIVMYFICPWLFQFLAPVQEVQTLGIRVLRIELLAEPLFGASIVASGCLRGAGDTLIPSIMNLASMWGVRITLAALLAGTMGLTGVWIAMCVELCFRGAIFLIRLKFGHWMDKA